MSLTADARREALRELITNDPAIIAMQAVVADAKAAGRCGKGSIEPTADGATRWFACALTPGHSGTCSPPAAPLPEIPPVTRPPQADELLAYAMRRIGIFVRALHCKSDRGVPTVILQVDESSAIEIAERLLKSVHNHPSEDRARG